MAHVEGVIIVEEVLEPVSLSIDELWMVPLEGQCSVHEGGHSAREFGEAEDEAILFLLPFQQSERIVRDIAHVPHAWLYAPVVFVLLYKRMIVEEPRVIAAHEAIRLGAAVHFLGHVYSSLGRISLVDVSWV